MNNNEKIMKALIESRIKKEELYDSPRHNVKSFLPEFTKMIANDVFGSKKPVVAMSDHNDKDGGIFIYLYPLSDRYFAALSTENYQHSPAELRASLSVVDKNDILDNLDNGINPIDYDVDDAEVYSGRLYGKELSDVENKVNKFSSECKNKIRKYSKGNTEGMYKFLNDNKESFGDFR